MAVQAMILMTTEQNNAAKALDNEDRRLGGRQINNPLANSLGLGALVGLWIAPARLLNNQDYAEYIAAVEGCPIHVFDSEVLFLPEEA